MCARVQVFERMRSCYCWFLTLSQRSGLRGAPSRFSLGVLLLWFDLFFSMLCWQTAAWVKMKNIRKILFPNFSSKCGQKSPMHLMQRRNHATGPNLHVCCVRFGPLIGGTACRDTFRNITLQIGFLCPTHAPKRHGMLPLPFLSKTRLGICFFSQVNLQTRSWAK